MADVEQRDGAKRARRREAREPVTGTVSEAPPAAPPQPPAISARGLCKRFGAITAVDDFTFDVRAGSVVGFVGPNGAGKTTTIRMLMGLIRPDAGEATVLGSPISAPARYLGEVGSLIEEPAVYPGLTGTKNLLVHCRLRGFDPERIAPTLAAVGLEDAASRPAGGYSLGMKKRLAIAAALLGNPRLLILDEPANGLDPVGMRDVRQLLRHLADQGRTVFVSSHLLSEVEQACDEVVVVQKGRLAFQGRLEDLLGTGEAEIVAVAEDPSQHRGLRRLCRDAGYAAEQRGDRIHVRAPASFAGELNRRAAAEGITLVELRRERLDLERVFFDLTEGEKEEVKP